MCKLNKSSSLAILAASLACSLATAAENFTNSEILVNDASLQTQATTDSRDPVTKDPIDIIVTPRPGEPETGNNALSPALITKPDGDARPVSIGEPLPKPTPDDSEPLPQWTRIPAGGMHMFQMSLSSLAILSIEARTSDSVLNVSVFDGKWNLLALFSSEGCGAYLMLPQSMLVNVVIENIGENSNEYILHVLDVK